MPEKHQVSVIEDLNLAYSSGFLDDWVFQGFRHTLANSAKTGKLQDPSVSTAGNPEDSAVDEVRGSREIPVIEKTGPSAEPRPAREIFFLA